MWWNNLLDENIEPYEKDYLLGLKNFKHKKVFIIIPLICISLFALGTIDLQNTDQTFNENEFLNYGMGISSRYNNLEFTYDSEKIRDSEYLSQLLKLKEDYKEYLVGTKDYEWKQNNTKSIIDSFESELEKINQQIIFLKNL